MNIKKIVSVITAAAFSAALCGSIPANAADETPRTVYIKTRYVPEEADRLALKELRGYSPRSWEKYFGTHVESLSLGQGIRLECPFGSDYNFAVIYEVKDGDNYAGSIGIYNMDSSGYNVQIMGVTKFEGFETSPEDPAVIVAGENGAYAVTSKNVTLLHQDFCAAGGMTVEEETEKLYEIAAEGFFPEGEYTKTAEVNCASELSITEGRSKKFGAKVKKLYSSDTKTAAVAENNTVKGVSAGKCYLTAETSDKNRIYKLNVLTNKIIPEKTYVRLKPDETETINIDLKIKDAVCVSETADTVYVTEGAAASARLENGKLIIKGIADGTDIVTVYSESDRSVRREITVDVIGHDTASQRRGNIKTSFKHDGKGGGVKIYVENTSDYDVYLPYGCKTEIMKFPSGAAAVGEAVKYTVGNDKPVTIASGEAYTIEPCLEEITDFFKDMDSYEIMIKGTDISYDYSAE